jgi:hypothetical protein
MLMKRFFLLLFTLTAMTATAQEFKPFKVNLSTGYALPIGKGASGGLLLSVEPKYGLSDRIDLGLRYELGLIIKAYTLNNEQGETTLKGASSYLITGNYLLSDTDFRPFIGAGAGVFSILSVNLSDNGGSVNGGISGGTKFGAMVRAGFKARHFVLGAEYNLVPKTRGIVVGQSGSNLNYESSNAYFGIKLGLDIGGGRYE